MAPATATRFGFLGDPKKAWESLQRGLDEEDRQTQRQEKVRQMQQEQMISALQGTQHSSISNNYNGETHGLQGITTQGTGGQLRIGGGEIRIGGGGISTGGGQLGQFGGGQQFVPNPFAPRLDSSPDEVLASVRKLIVKVEELSDVVSELRAEIAVLRAREAAQPEEEGEEDLPKLTRLSDAYSS